MIEPKNDKEEEISIGAEIKKYIILFDVISGNLFFAKFLFV